MIKHNGITLLELLVVIVLIGIIASIAFVSLGNVIENTKEKSFLLAANAMISSAEIAFS